MSNTSLRRLTTIASHLTRPTASATRSFKLGSLLSTQSSPAMTADAKQLVDQAIKENKIVMFGKTYCPYCKKAKVILEKEGDLKDIELDQMDNGAEIQAYLKSLNGQGTVPHVYLGGKFVGGCSELQALSSDKIKKMIAA